MRELSFAQAINEALHIAMQKDSNMLLYGLGVPDPKNIFGTTVGLQEAFGEQRVFDMPCSENGMTGIAIGASLNGVRSVFVHQRLDFFLLALDQLINNAAKWYYMFGGTLSVPITIRLIIGRGWGQGPTHSQSLQSLLAHIPGLKVVMPTTPQDAKGLLLASIFDPNPVVFLEHRWLHNIVDEVDEGYFELPLQESQVVREGKDITIVAYSLMAIEALKAAHVLATIGIDVEVIDMKTISPVDMTTIYQSVNKTGRLVALDLSHESVCIGSDIIAKVAIKCFHALKTAPQLIALPDVPSPTSYALTKAYYKNANDVIIAVGEMLDKPISEEVLIKTEQHHDIPGEWFQGPF